MIIPHLMFAHMLADYVLQSNWLVAQKSKAWTGLVMHAGIVGFAALVALAPYLAGVWAALVVLVVVHGLQDHLKIYLGPRLRVHPFVPYAVDQLAHYALIGVLQLWVGRRVSASHGEIVFMWTGAAVVAVTRFYDVTWWANWLDMIPYMKRWRLYGATERLAMLSLAAAGGWMLAPLAALPRLVNFAQTVRQGQRPAWKRRRAGLEILLGIALSVALGIGLAAL